MAVKDVKKPKSKGKIQAELELDAAPVQSRFALDFLGLGLLLFCGISLLSLVADFGASNDGHLLGPYLGNWLALMLRRSMGKLPIFLTLLWGIALGLRVMGIKNAWNSMRNLLFSALLLSEFLALLSVRMLNLPFFTLDDFENSGGVWGNFLVHFLLAPVVQEKVAGAYVIVASIIVFTLVWGLKLSPKDLIQYLISLKPERSAVDHSPVFAEDDQAPAIQRTKPKARPKLPEPEPILEDDLFEDDLPFDPRKIRQIRDEREGLERDRRVNEWEDRYQEAAPEIGGIVQPIPVAAPVPPAPREQMNRTKTMPRVAARIPAEIKAKAPESYDAYAVPVVESVFPIPPEQVLDLTTESLRSQASHLEAQLANFGVKGKVVNITTGPVITRFEIDLAPGVKLSKVAGLGDDLALAIRAKSVRVLAPIPGKSAVGIEIPNPKSQIVFCREVLAAEEFHAGPDQIIIGLGKDIAGRPYVMDLATAPHMLIAGQTGSGKSVCINMLMASLLCSKTPDELRLLLVDPKVVELKPYEHIPHLLAPVITNPEIAIQALSWACYEMDRRYEVLARARVRNIAGFNQKFANNQLVDLVDAEDNCKMPYLVIIVDEFADLMMVAGKQVEVAIARIAQKARAVGIHLVLATQRPSTNVITGVIKANLPTRIAFKVASQIDARTIMDKAGSEKLLGRGDMLFRSVNDPEPTRVHGAFLTDQEVEVLAAACSSQNVNYPQLASFDFQGDGQDNSDRDMGPRDEKFAEAAEMVVSIGQASTSMLQRRMQLGYARAGRIMDQLEAAGIVGRDRGAKGREILMSEEDLRSFLSGNLDLFD